MHGLIMVLSANDTRSGCYKRSLYSDYTTIPFLALSKEIKAVRSPAAMLLKQ